jgi:histidinol-phosphate phosphatase family protein
MEWIGVDEVYEAVVSALTARPGGAEAGPAATPAVFLDRDGTLNRDVGYLNDPDRLELLPGVEAAIRSFNRAALRVVVVTNQSGLARGLVTEAQLDAIHRRLRERLARAGAVVDAIYHCPHHPDARCACRKPGAALVEQARARWAIDLARSYVVGDKLVDMQLARRVGATGVLVRSGHGEQTLVEWPAGEPPPDHLAADLADAAHWIVSRAVSPQETLVR